MRRAWLIFLVCALSTYSGAKIFWFNFGLIEVSFFYRSRTLRCTYQSCWIFVTSRLHVFKLSWTCRQCQILMFTTCVKFCKWIDSLRFSTSWNAHDEVLQNRVCRAYAVYGKRKVSRWKWGTVHFQLETIFLAHIPFIGVCPLYADVHPECRMSAKILSFVRLSMNLDHETHRFSCLKFCSTTISCPSMAVVQMHLLILNLHVIISKSAQIIYSQLLIGKHTSYPSNSSAILYLGKHHTRVVLYLS